MKLYIIAVGQRVPDWAQSAYADYAKRFPPELKVLLKAVKTEPRAGGKTTAQVMAAERQRIEAALPKGAHVVALDERGTALGTPALAARLRAIRRRGRWRRACATGKPAAPTWPCSSAGPTGWTPACARVRTSASACLN